MEFKEKIHELIDKAKDFVKGKSIDTLSEIVNGYKKKEYHTKPGNLSFEIKSTGETAYQRAIFLSKKTTLKPLGEVIWNDLELPVVFSNSRRRRCVDLIGTLNNDKLVLCELKFTSTNSYHSESPIYAVLELLIYYYLIKDNSKELDKKKVFHTNSREPFEWSDINSNSIFIFGANNKYWDYWKKRYEKQKGEIDLWLKGLPIKVRFFSSDDFDFKDQKENKEKYTPSVSEKTEWTEVFL
ncbi:MAG: hypothetical protein COZ75_04665 [Flavobacteriaceae bacterium CG_4_8_14_3_um_filter_34_10]|nr:MAG: hypothetical protein COS19_09360 [Flavobacteriaceae bacterium CG02_land_8_20_14_3_00_34_13]PIX09835.1 MAG: hypothetical protein COZ75_04665 [Flavobacteriaceae bacterium CG_4_8_14_3_um_filter_34_10]